MILPARASGTPERSPLSVSCPDIRQASVPACGRPKDWLPVGCITADSLQASESMQFLFSPDGFHCALLANGQCSLWGPDRSGQYRRKLFLRIGSRVKNAQFTPDASRLLVSFSPVDAEAWELVYYLACLPLLPERKGPVSAAGLPPGQNPGDRTPGQNPGDRQT